jgi:S-adenosyl-L-methionine hydrolase (adenosine-forming)
LFDEKPIQAFVIDTQLSTSFPELDVFAKVACDIINGANPESIGMPTDKLVRRVSLHATIEDSIIIGRIVYIDSYQNAITNISYELFQQVGKDRQFKIFVQSNGNVISKINKTYQETSPGELLAIFNSINLLEIAISEGNAAELLNLDTNSTVRIKFK